MDNNGGKRGENKKEPTSCKPRPGIVGRSAVEMRTLTIFAGPVLALQF
jgi:hypothetical protein